LNHGKFLLPEKAWAETFPAIYGSIHRGFTPEGEICCCRNVSDYIALDKYFCF
jgi:hypothetical protein